ncbi:MAG: glycoside hydrolase family 25 protein [Ruminococcus sp.]|nr:glycoside hydrolase family 25 protein [Ruminococcus sp.]
MRIYKKLLSVLMSCTFIGSGAALSTSEAFAENNISCNIYDTTIDLESKEASGSISQDIYDGNTVDAASLTETPYNVFDIYNAHQKYVKLHSGDTSLMYKKAEGIDVSYAQGKIDWKAVKDSGIDFAIIRAGFGNADKYPYQKDTWFQYNIEEARKVGIDIGIYWYSYAYSVEEAREEAESCYNIIKGYDIQYPVYFDIEEEGQKKLPVAEISAIIDSFCSTIESKGYYAGIYSFSSLLSSKVYQQVLDKYAIWVAHWGVKAPGFKGDYGMWQHSDKGRVNGIDVVVDLDHCYVNYPYLISPDTYEPDGTETDTTENLRPISVDKGVASGIDVSVWQGKVDWEKVNDAGIDYAMIRAGYGNLASQTDKYFEANIEGAEKAGIDCGTYWYSYAESPEDAVLEAEACLEVIGGHKFSYPVYYCVEDQCFATKSNEEITAIINAFCSTLEKKGYYVGIKSYANFLNTRVDEAVYSKYDVWVSHYGVSKPEFSKNYNMWQYANDGKIDGLNGAFNLDYAYLKFPEIMKNNHLNGF